MVIDHNLAWFNQIRNITKFIICLHYGVVASYFILPNPGEYIGNSCKSPTSASSMPL